MEEVYRPAEDSYMLQGHVECLARGRVLDMGTGSGIQAVTAAMKPEVTNVTAVDINPIALQVAGQRARNNGVEHKIVFTESDLFDKVQGRYDWILFNPPYLPSEGDIDEAVWAGGKTGKELLKRFLAQAPRFLSVKGTILVLYSDKTGMTCEDFTGFTVNVLEKKGLFFETLICAALTPS